MGMNLIKNTRYLPNLLQDRLHSLPLIVLYLTDGCNSRCAMCDIWRAPRRNMPLDMVDNLVEHAQKLNTQIVLLSGGEAMQHPDWPLIASKFRAVGIQVWLLTNGLLLNKQADLVAAHIDRVIISLDAGTAALYKHIRGVDALQLILDGMRTVSTTTPVSTRTTVMKANYHEMPLIVDVALANGASSVSFLAVDTTNPFAFGPRFEDSDTIPLHSEPHEFGGLAESDLPEFHRVLAQLMDSHDAHFAERRIEESPSKLWRLYDYFAAPYGKASFAPPRCNAPHISVVVNVDGRLQPCYFLPPDNNSIGIDNLNSQHMQAMRHAYRQQERPECTRCVCPLYRGPRSLLMGI